MAALKAKLEAALYPGCVVEFEPDEAELAGAFADDAITLDDALASSPDLLDEVP